MRKLATGKWHWVALTLLGSLTLASHAGAVTKLNGALVSGGDVGVVGYPQNFQISPDSSRVVYLADQDTDNVVELYSVPIGGGAVTKLHGALASGGSIRGDFQISPDSSRVVYGVWDPDLVSGWLELYSVPIGGGAVTKLHGGAVGTLGLVPHVFQISPDSSRVVYVASDPVSGWLELYSVPIGGGAVTKLSASCALPSPDPGCGADIFQISPDGSRVVYRTASTVESGRVELWSVPIGGGVQVLLHWPFSLYDPGIEFQISPDSSRVVYRADSPTGVVELYSVPIGGGGPDAITKLNGTLVSGGWVSSFEISPDGSRVVYRAVQDTDNVFELYSVPIGGGGPDAITKLNGTLVSGGNVGDFQISPDSSRVVYRADQDTDNVSELYSVPIGGGAVTKLNGVLVSGGDVYGFQISPDGSRVVYRAVQDTDNVFELYSVPIGGGAVTKLNGALVSGGNVGDFQISPDSSRVVYRADQDTDNVSELYSVPIGGGAVTKLNGALVSGGWVWSFEISPDSSRVVYLADQDTDDVVELYSVRLARSPEEAGQNLIDDVESLFDSATLTAEQRDGLTAKLNAALASLAKGKTEGACNQLQAFINQVSAFINDGTLTSAEGEELIGAANAIRTWLSC